MTFRLHLCITLFVLLLGASEAASPAIERFGFHPNVMIAHLETGETTIRAESNWPADLSGMTLSFAIEVNSAGRVTSVTFLSAGGGIAGTGSGDVLSESREVDLDPATRAAIASKVKAWIFRPFFWRGRPVTAVGTVHVIYNPPPVPERKPFGISPPIGSDWSVTLWRQNYAGMSPVYNVTVRGDGSNTFSAQPRVPYRLADGSLNLSFDHMLVGGQHEGRSSPSDVGLVKDLMARVFLHAIFSGAASTRRGVPHLTIRVGYTTLNMYSFERVPDSYFLLRDAVERVANSDRWVRGDAETVRSLVQEGFDFTSDQAVLMLAAAIGLGADDSLIYKLIDLGVPLDTVVRVGRRPVQYMPLGAFLGHQAASTGRAELLGSLARNGWLKNVPLRGLNEAFLNGSSCDGRIPQILVEAGVKPTVRDEWGATALMRIRSTCRNAGSRGADYIRSLLRLGVPLEARDKEGRTALFQLSEPEIADALLQEGANPRVLDRKGNSAVHSSSDDRVTVTLLDAGASPKGRNVYGWTLREAAQRQGWVGTLSWLDQRGLP